MGEWVGSVCRLVNIHVFLQPLIVVKWPNWRASEASETPLIVVQWKMRYVYTYIYILLASERSERDTIRGVQIRAGAVRIYYNNSTLPRGISINIAPKVGIFPEAEGRGKYSLPRVQYYRYSTRKG